MLDSKARLARAGHRVQNKANKADDERAPKCGPKTVHIKMWSKHIADEVKQQSIDDEGEKAERKKQEWQGQEHEHGTQNRVENSEEQRGHEQIERLFVMDTLDQVNRYQDRQRIDEPTLDKFFQTGRHL